MELLSLFGMDQALLPVVFDDPRRTVFVCVQVFEAESFGFHNQIVASNFKAEPSGQRAHHHGDQPVCQCSQHKQEYERIDIQHA